MSSLPSLMRVLRCPRHCTAMSWRELVTFFHLNCMTSTNGGQTNPYGDAEPTGSCSPVSQGFEGFAGHNTCWMPAPPCSHHDPVPHPFPHTTATSSLCPTPGPALSSSPSHSSVCQDGQLRGSTGPRWDFWAGVLTACTSLLCLPVVGEYLSVPHSTS